MPSHFHDMAVAAEGVIMSMSPGPDPIDINGITSLGLQQYRLGASVCLSSML